MERSPAEIAAERQYMNRRGKSDLWLASRERQRQVLQRATKNTGR